MNPQASGVLTTVPGDPEQVRRIAALFATVEARAQEIQSRLRAIESGIGPQMWRGQAADGFAALLAETGPDLTTLATSYGTAGRALATYATELAAAQDTARAARSEVTTATEARARAIADRDSARIDADRHGATADDAQVRMDPFTAQDAEQRRTDAFARENSAAAAAEQAERALQTGQRMADDAADQRNVAAARCIRELDGAANGGIEARGLTRGAATVDGASSATRAERDSPGAGLVDFGQTVWNDVREKWHFNAADFSAALVGGYFAAHRSVVRGHAEFLKQKAETYRGHYLRTPGGDPWARRLTEMEFDTAARARELERRAASLHRAPGNVVAGKIPIIGLGITAAGIAYDIHNGKPAGKAAVSGVAGLGAGIVFGLAVTGPVGWVALGGVAASVVAGVVADEAFDALPTGVQDAISDGVEATANGIAEGAKNAWNAIF